MLVFLLPQMHENDQQERQLDNVTHKLAVAVVDCAIRPKKENFVLYRLNDKDFKYTRKAIRVQTAGSKKSESLLLKIHPNTIRVLLIETTPNARILYDNLCEQIYEVLYNRGYIKLPISMSEEEFIRLIIEIYEEKSLVEA